jgi:L-aspartate oxidase
MNNDRQFDVLVIGSGASGLSVALRLAMQGLKVAIVCKGQLTESATFYAQGGIAAVMSLEDSLESHVNDTVIAGAGLCDAEVVRFTVTRAKDAIKWLIQNGVEFTMDQNDAANPSYHLTREGGHSHRRVLHAADATGYAVETSLSHVVRNQKNITILENHIAVDLIKNENKIVGAYIYDEDQQTVKTILAKAVVLATGGASRVYLYTTNPDVASGDGIAMAWRAGCPVANLEFNQFHPTCLYHPQARTFLITEALRGEGAILRLPNGETFMSRFHEQGELAPRDCVARAIDHEMKRLGVDCLYLDITHKPADFIKQHFPTIYDRCLHYGLDITQDQIPIVPAAHYTCGGVLTDTYGRTALTNLYAIGEVACTGLHGANRMASNSLLECLVFASSCAEAIMQTIKDVSLPTKVKAWDESRVTDSDEEIVVSHNWHELRHLMWNYMGIVRTNKRLHRAMHRIQLLQQEIQEYYQHFRVSRDLLELRNLVLVGELMVRCAFARQESRGLHFSLDYPETLAQAENTILRKDNQKSATPA